MPGNFIPAGNVIGAFLKDAKLQRRLADPKVDLLLMVGYLLRGREKVTRHSVRTGTSVTLTLVHEPNGNAIYEVATNQLRGINIDDEITVFSATILPNREVVYTTHEAGNWEKDLQFWYVDDRAHTTAAGKT